MVCAVPVVSLETTPSEGDITFNAELTLNCSYDTAGQVVGRVQWFVNGMTMSGTDGPNSSVLRVPKLLIHGYYQCFVLTQDGTSNGSSVEIFPQCM